MANSYMSQDKTRRFGLRAVRILNRHKTAYPYLNVFESTLVPRVETFVSLHDRLAVSTTNKSRERLEGVQAVTFLAERVKGWLAALRRDVSGFDTGIFSIDSKVPDDVIGTAGRLVQAVGGYTDGEGKPLPYAEELRNDLTVAIDAAEKEWSEAQDALSALQTLQAEVRAAGGALNRELIAFRRAVGAALGRSHRDFQRLRVERSQSEADDEELDGVDDDVDAEDFDGESVDGESVEDLETADTAPGVLAGVEVKGG